MSTPKVGHSPGVGMMSRVLDLPALTSPDVCFAVVSRIGEGQRDSMFFAEMGEKKQPTKLRIPNNQTPKPNI